MYYTIYCYIVSRYIMGYVAFYFSSYACKIYFINVFFYYHLYIRYIIPTYLMWPISHMYI